MTPLCVIETPFREKFGVPRQSLLIPEAWGLLRFPKNDFTAEAFRGIESSSHLWLIFEFSLVDPESIQALVRPPRLGGKQKMGVFATRSPHRPNRLGLSVVKFEGWEETDKEIILHVSGVDLVSGTPIFDIKPYVPYVDSIPEARSPFSVAPEFHPVKWDCEFEGKERSLIEKVISLDPRPAHQRDEADEYGVSVAGYNIKFKNTKEGLMILKVSKESL